MNNKNRKDILQGIEGISFILSKILTNFCMEKYRRTHPFDLAISLVNDALLSFQMRMTGYSDGG